MCIVFVPLVLGIVLFYKNTSLFHLSSTAILLDFVQVCGLFAALSLGWSSQAGGYLSGVTFFNFNVDFVAVPCAFGSTRSYFNRFIFIMVFPLAIAAVFALIYTGWALLARVWPHPDQQMGRQKTSAFTVLRTVATAKGKRTKFDANSEWSKHYPSKVADTSSLQSSNLSGRDLGVEHGQGDPTLVIPGSVPVSDDLVAVSAVTKAEVTGDQVSKILVAGRLNTDQHTVDLPVVSEVQPSGPSSEHDADGDPNGYTATETVNNAYTVSMRRRSSVAHNGSFLKTLLGGHSASWSIPCFGGSCWVPYFEPHKRFDQVIDAYLLFLTMAHIPLSRNCLSYFRCVTVPDRRYLVSAQASDFCWDFWRAVELTAFWILHAVRVAGRRVLYW